MKPDKITRQWMRDASDEWAVHNGCRFDEGRGLHAVNWCEEYLRLYEGVWAGQPFKLRGFWTYEAWMRLFGWVRPNEDWRTELPHEDWIRRFRSSFWMVAKKNMKSPNLAALILYMLIGDLREGEEGQKCFPTAKDGLQVKQNVVRHVHEMIRRSEALNAECTINKTTASVYHEATSSLMLPLSGDNVRTQESKEGLNGSTFVDEVHVVDEHMVETIDRAGISRPEPLHVEVTTAGKDPDSYGFRRTQYARDVRDGHRKDDGLLAILYEAPPDLTDEALLADPVRYGKMANPAWGHTVKEKEFLADLERSKGSPRKMAKFKMYRCNVWMHGETPWLNIHKWDNCVGSRAINPSRPAYGGLDLSSKRDFTAWRLVQKQGDTWVTAGHAWVTEARAREHENNGLDIRRWVEDGGLTIIPGERIQYSYVVNRVVEDCRRLDVVAVGYDPWQAEATRQELENDHDIPMVEVPQGYKSLTNAAKELEVSVEAEQLDHGGDECLRWMAKNATVRENGDNICPEKPNRTSMKAIDGIVSLIMAIGQAEADESIPACTEVIAV